MNGALKVQPEVLSGKAEELQGHRNNISSIMEQTNSQIVSLTGTWKGNASESYQNQYKQVHDDIDRILSFVDEYVGDLHELAGIYQRGETEALNVASSLPTEGVF